MIFIGDGSNLDDNEEIELCGRPRRKLRMAPNDSRSSSSNRTCDLSIAANLIFLAKKSAQVASASNYLTVAIIMFMRRRGGG